MVVEGYHTVRAASELALSKEGEMPITSAVAKVLFGGLPPLEAVSGLMLREAKSELASASGEG